MDERDEQKQTRGAYLAPMLAIVSVIVSLACCLPLAFLAALGTLGASAVFATLRPWLRRRPRPKPFLLTARL
jgi:hypothetical protein